MIANKVTEKQIQIVKNAYIVGKAGLEGNYTENINELTDKEQQIYSCMLELIRIPPEELRAINNLIESSEVISYGRGKNIIEKLTTREIKAGINATLMFQQSEYLTKKTRNEIMKNIVYI